MGPWVLINAAWYQTSEYNIASISEGGFGLPFEPAVTALHDGGHFAAWLRSDIGGRDVIGQFFGFQGQAQNEIQLNSSPDVQVSNIDAASLLGTDAVVVWEVTGAGVFARLAQPFGVVGGEIPLENGTSLGESPAVASLPVSASLPNGGFVAVWHADAGGGNSDVIVRRFHADGMPDTAPTVVNSSTGTMQNADVARLQDGGYIVSWEQVTAGSQHTIGVFAQRFDAAGQMVSRSGATIGADEFIGMDGFIVDNPHDASIAGLADGGFVVVAEAAEGNAMAAIFGRRFDANGNLVSSEDAEGFQRVHFLISENLLLGQENPSVSANPDGGFVVVWETNDLSLGDVTGQRYDGNGSRLDGNFEVNEIRPGDQYRPVAAALTDGSFVATWSNSVGSKVSARRFDAEGNALASVIITGTDADDVIRGDTALDGGGGDDTLFGSGGADTLMVTTRLSAASGTTSTPAAPVSTPRFSRFPPAPSSSTWTPAQLWTEKAGSPPSPTSKASSAVTATTCSAAAAATRRSWGIVAPTRSRAAAATTPLTAVILSTRSMAATWRCLTATWASTRSPSRSPAVRSLSPTMVPARSMTVLTHCTA